jgi:hypothetical protein
LFNDFDQFSSHLSKVLDQYILYDPVVRSRLREPLVIRRSIPDKAMDAYNLLIEDTVAGPTEIPSSPQDIEDTEELEITDTPIVQLAANKVKIQYAK